MPFSTDAVYSEQVVLTASVTVDTYADPGPPLSTDEGTVAFYVYDDDSGNWITVSGCDAVALSGSQAQCTLSAAFTDADAVDDYFDFYG